MNRERRERSKLAAAAAAGSKPLPTSRSQRKSATATEASSRGEKQADTDFRGYDDDTIGERLLAAAAFGYQGGCCALAPLFILSFRGTLLKRH
jgi:hypothetical protein